MSVLDLSGTNIAKIENSQEAMGFLLKKWNLGGQVSVSLIFKITTL